MAFWEAKHPLFPELNVQKDYESDIFRSNKPNVICIFFVKKKKKNNKNLQVMDDR